MNQTPDQTPDPAPDEVRRPFLRSHAATFKMFSVIILVLLLLIPLGMVRSVLKERMAGRNAAVAEISSSWGGEQSIVGPVLVVPFTHTVKVWKERTVDGRQERFEVDESRVASAFFLPDELNATVAVKPSKLYRGIHEAVVYEAALDLSGRFSAPDFSRIATPDATVHWDRAAFTMSVSDLRGTSGILTLDVGGQSHELHPGSRLPGFDSGISASFPDPRTLGTGQPFSMHLNLKGSSGLRLAPVGKQNLVTMTSPWPDPSFKGAFLPARRTVGPQGFDAAWEVSWYGRGYPQESTDVSGDCALNASAVSGSLFGVDFMSPVDSYRMVERATKYGVLFISLVFIAFFLFEALQSLRIHSIQYTLVGAALCLFYLGVLALSEFWHFGPAYWTGAAASSLLIVAYCFSVLRSGRRTGIIAAELVGIYTYLYVVLQMQDLSLLFGTVLLFVVLGIVMYATRRLDWAAWE